MVKVFGNVNGINGHAQPNDIADPQTGLTKFDQWLADRIDPTRLTDPQNASNLLGATAPEVAMPTKPLSASDIAGVDRMMEQLTFVTDPTAKIQASTWIKQYLSGDPRHNAAIYWHMPYMDLHTHVHGVLSTEVFLKLVQNSIVGVEKEFWENLSGRYSKFLDNLKKPIKGENFEYSFDEKYHKHVSHGLPVPEKGNGNLEGLAKALELSSPRNGHSCSISYSHAYDLRGLIRDAVEEVTADKGVGLRRATMQEIAGSLARQRVGSVDMQVSMSFLDRPEAGELLAACNAHGIHVNYLAYELSIKRLHLGEMSEEDEAKLEAALRKGICSGVDYCGPELLMTEKGMAVFERTLKLLSKVANETGRVLTMRPHVGEGYTADKATASAKEVGQRNIELMLNTIEKYYREHGRDPLVEVRFGHATHTTPEQAARMKELGVVVEGNPYSNETTRVATRDELGVLQWVTYAVQHLFGTDGAGVMGGEMKDVENLEEAILWAFRNGFSTKDTLIEGDQERGKLAFADLVAQRADEIMFARLKKNNEQTEGAVPSDDDKVQAERELWNIFSMERVKGLAEMRRLDMGWKMRRTGEIPPVADRSAQLQTALYAVAKGDWTLMNQFLRSVFFFRGRAPTLPRPTGMPTAFEPRVSLKNPALQARALHDQVSSLPPVTPFKPAPSVAAEQVKAPAKVDKSAQEKVEAALKDAVLRASVEIDKIPVPTLEELQGAPGEKTVSLEDAFVFATSGLSKSTQDILGRRLEFGTAKRACIEGWTLVVDDKRNIAGVQLLANRDETGKLSHYVHLGAGGLPVERNDNASRYFTRNLAEMLELRGGPKGLLTGPTGQPLVVAGPVGVNNDPKRLGLFAAVLTQATEADVGGKHARTGDEHRVLVNNEKGEAVFVEQKRQASKKWETVSLEELEAFIAEKEAQGPLLGHTVDLKYLAGLIKSLKTPRGQQTRHVDALIKRLEQGALVADPLRDAKIPERPLEQVSASGQALLKAYFDKVAAALEAELKPLSKESSANFKKVRDLIEKGAGDFKGIGALLKKQLHGININVSDAPLVRVQFRKEPPQWVAWDRTPLSYAPKGFEARDWHLESISADSTEHGLLLRYFDVQQMAA